MKKRFLLLMCFFIIPSARAANPLIADLSTYAIRIDSGFTGTHVLMFGARNEAGDVVVVIRGPLKTYTIRKKKQVSGIWVNRDAVTFAGVPHFYAIASSRPLHEIRASPMLQPLLIGETQFLQKPSDKSRAKLSTEEFAQAFLDHQHSLKLYNTNASLQFMGETLFKTSIDFPDIIPDGDYTAEAYLFSGDELLGVQDIPITVSKSGLEAGIYALAHHQPVLYGLLAVSLALSAGWAASRLFEKI